MSPAYPSASTEPIVGSGPNPDANSPTHYVYTRTILPSPLILKSLVGHFSGGKQPELLVSNEASLTLYSIAFDNTLSSWRQFSPAGLITDIDTLPHIIPQAFPRSLNSARDLLLCLTDQGTLSIVGIDTTPGPSGGLGPTPPCRFQVLQELVVSPLGLNPFNRNHRLCVDPLSRAFAVTALKNSFQIFLVNNAYYNRHFIATDGVGSKPMGPSDELSPDLTQTPVNVPTSAAQQSSPPLRVDLIQESRIFSVPGTILHLAFLHPRSHEKDRVLLAMVLVLDHPVSAVSIYIYEFWLRPPLPTPDQPRSTPSTILKDTRHYARLPFPRGASFPRHLIPLAAYPESFLLVNKHELLWIDAEDAASGHVHHVTHQLPLHPCHHSPLGITTFATTPPRASDSATTCYLGTADQCLIRVTLGLHRQVKIRIFPFDSPGCLSLAVLSSDRWAGDSLLVAGDMGDHRILLVAPPFESGSHTGVVIKQNLPNSAPIHSLVVAPGAPGRPKTIWLAGGQWPTASITRIRHQTPVTIPYESDPAFPHAQGIWVLSHESKRYIVLSYTDNTRVLSWRGDALFDAELGDTFAHSTSTVYCGTLPTHSTQVQVVPTMVSWWLHHLDGDTAQPIKWTAPSRITQATIAHDHVIVISTSASTGPLGWQLLSLRLSSDPSPKILEYICPTRFPTEASSLLAYHHEAVGRLECFVGVYPASLTRLSWSGKDWIHVGTYTPDPRADLDLRTIHSMAWLDRSPETIYLLLGLRSGDCVGYPVFKPTVNRDLDVQWDQPRLFRLGHLPVRLFGFEAQPQRAIVAQSEQLWEITDSPQGPLPIPMAYTPAKRLAALVPLGNSDGTQGNYIALADDRLVQLSTRPGTRQCIKRWPSTISPKHIHFDPLTNTLIVTGHNPTLELDQLLVVDPETGRTLAHQSLLPREQVFCFCAWTIQDKRQYRYFCIGTSLPDGGGPSEDRGNGSTSSGGGGTGLGTKGRVVMYNVKRTPPAQPTPVDLKFVWDLEREGTITRMAPFGLNGLIVASTSQVTDPVPLDSPVRALDTRGHLLVLAPIAGPLQLWRYDPVQAQFNLEQSTSSALHVCRTLLLAPSVVLAAGQFGGLLGLARPLANESDTGSSGWLSSTPSDQAAIHGPELALRPDFWMSTYDTFRQLATSTQNHLPWALHSPGSWGDRRDRIPRVFRDYQVESTLYRLEGQQTEPSAFPTSRSLQTMNLDLHGDADIATNMKMDSGWAVSSYRPGVTSEIWDSETPTPTVVYGGSLTGTVFGLLPIRASLFRILAAIQQQMGQIYRSGYSGINNGFLASFPSLRLAEGEPRRGHAQTIAGTTPWGDTTPGVINGDLVHLWFNQLSEVDRQIIIQNCPELMQLARAFMRHLQLQGQANPSHLGLAVARDNWYTGTQSSSNLANESEPDLSRFTDILAAIVTELDLAIGFTE
ncbi:mono-functional DNA-alkylating methyl methanesulfonate N-term-domain-containing protein [Dimargaris cristalligena]|uniref:Mono-functional DNA-alkylating methyl methanesulfonate N-term-domain-containing protein n=1 Tax=Dimargaris cristalligena TaxID=215637 RepID=A0A4P9ZXK3_9FUNG|nr:mono-functional DNA-alkylating methyl methanesulfonate N-term-domain-containing protein [Dimargaris cristalligena]|eukprot:RKP37460.1 mono-functional DNA-alkylating methyl methanesulfonate N-term-domain-containing protein [Dimargaris cristalligena]